MVAPFVDTGQECVRSGWRSATPILEAINWLSCPRLIHARGSNGNWHPKWSGYWRRWIRAIWTWCIHRAHGSNTTSGYWGAPFRTHRAHGPAENGIFLPKMGKFGSNLLSLDMVVSGKQKPCLLSTMSRESCCRLKALLKLTRDVNKQVGTLLGRLPIGLANASAITLLE